MTSKFILREHGQGRYFIIFQTHSGQVLLTNEGHTDKDSALRSLESMRHSARHADNYETRTAENGEVYFVVKNARGKVLGLSEMYPDVESLQKGIHLVKGNARGARLEDLTKKVLPERPRPVKHW